MDVQTSCPVRRVRLFSKSKNIPQPHEMPDREMVMQKQYKGIDNITAEDRELVLTCLAHWRDSRQRPDKEKIKTLFTKYHEYVYKSPSDMGCPSCVQFIYDYWCQTTEGWKRTNAERT